MTTNPHDLIDACRARAMYLRARRYPAVDHDDAEQYLAIGCLKALRRYNPSRGAKLTTFAIALIKGEFARENAQNRYGWELDGVEDPEQAALRAKLRQSGSVDDALIAVGLWSEPPDIAEQVAEQARIERERTGILPPVMRGFVRVLLDDSLTTAQAAKRVKLTDRQGRNLVAEAVALLERHDGSQCDLFGGALV